MSSIKRLQTHYKILNTNQNVIQNKFNLLQKNKAEKDFNNIIHKVYLINLEKDKDRFNHVSQQLQYLGIPFERFNAIYGKDIDIEELSRDNILKRQALKMAYTNKGSLGCYLSHVGVYQKILSEPYENVLILEDDVDIINDFKNGVISLYPKLPKDWEIIYLGYNMVHGDNVNGDYYVPKEGNHQGYNSGMFGYMLNKNGARRLIDILIPIYHPIKDPVIRSNIKRIKAFFVAKKLIFHNAIKFESERNKIH